MINDDEEDEDDNVVLAYNDDDDGYDEYSILFNRDIDDVDLYSGALGESRVKDAGVGATYVCLLSKQFKNLRSCDRFWFENPAFFNGKDEYF